MKRFFITLAILSVCQIARAADVNSVDPNLYLQKIKELERTVTAQQQKIDRLTAALADAKKEIERFQAEVVGLKKQRPQKQTDEPNVVLPFTGEETPLTMVKAYPNKYIGKTFIVIGCMRVEDSYISKYFTATGTHVSLSLDEIRSNLTATGESVNLYVRREISKELVEKITKAVDAGIGFVVIRAKATILENRYESGGGVATAELVNWQFYSNDKKDWQDWVISEGTAKPRDKIKGENSYRDRKRR